MSDSYLRYVPTDPEYRPTPAAATRALEMLRTLLPDAESVASRFTDAVEFVDAGANWDGVVCPACGADAESWWDDAMSEVAERQFESLRVRACCCDAVVSLNDLQYGWPVAFASFILEAANPNSVGLLPQQLEQLGFVLSCSLREIKVHI